MSNTNSKQKLSFEEISQMLKRREIEKLFGILDAALKDSEKPFHLKVTKARNQNADLTIIIDGKIVIDLINNLELKSKQTMAIIPVKSSLVPRVLIVDEIPLCQVSPTDYQVITKELEQIYSEYCQDGMNFGHIPYTWFPTFRFVEIVHNFIWDTSYFQKRLVSSHVEVGADWSQENRNK